MLPAGLSLGVAYLALVAAYAAGPVTTVAPLVGTQPLWALLVASVVLGRSEAVARGSSGRRGSSSPAAA